jgi:hypothetical protein
LITSWLFTYISYRKRIHFKVFLGEKFIYSPPTYQSFHSVVVITSAFNAIKKLDERSCGAIQRYYKLNKIRSIDSVI